MDRVGCYEVYIQFLRMRNHYFTNPQYEAVDRITGTDESIEKVSRCCPSARLGQTLLLVVVDVVRTTKYEVTRGIIQKVEGERSAPHIYVPRPPHSAFCLRTPKSVILFSSSPVPSAEISSMSHITSLVQAYVPPNSLKWTQILKRGEFSTDGAHIWLGISDCTK